MSNFNRVILIGRLTRDPEVRTFGNGGKVAKFGFAVSHKRKDQSGQYVDEPMFIDVEAFNRGDRGTLANVVEQYCRKGSLICIEGRLKLEQWDDKATGAKRSKHAIVADAVQLIDTKTGPKGEYQEPARQQERREPPEEGPVPSGGEEIPF